MRTTGLTSDFGTIGTVPEAVGTDSEDLTKHHSCTPRGLRYGAV